MNPRATASTARKQSQILLVDDHPLVRERLGEVINREPDLRVAAEAEDRYQALDLIERKQPDLVIIDLTLKNSSGLELIKDIHTRGPKLLMLVVSMHDESLYAERVVRAGARGYITKQEATRNILLAIRRVLDGEIYLNEKVAIRLISRLAAPPAKGGTMPPEVLADRELQIFELIGRGFNTRDIGAQLHISAKTVETYRARIREKLALQDSNDLLRLAISWAHRS